MAGSDWDMFSCDKNQYTQPVISCWVGEVGVEKQAAEEKTKAVKRVPVIQILGSSQKLNYLPPPNHEYSAELEKDLLKHVSGELAPGDSSFEFSLVDLPTTSNQIPVQSTAFELFPPNLNNTGHDNQEFNFELLDAQFESRLLAAPVTAEKAGNCSEKFSTTIDSDILNSVVSDILCDEQNLEYGSTQNSKYSDTIGKQIRSDQPNLECASDKSKDVISKPLRKGKKRGRKLGYRSETSNDDNAICGVCGAKVSLDDISEV